MLLAGGSEAEEDGYDAGLFNFTIVNIGITATWDVGSAMFLFAGGGTYNQDIHLCGSFSFGTDCNISSIHFGDGSAHCWWMC